MPATKAQILAYRRKLDRIIKDAKAIENETYRLMAKALKGYQDGLNMELAIIAGEYPRIAMTAQQLGVIKDYVAKNLPGLRTQLAEILSEGQEKMWTLGGESAAASLTSLGFKVGVAPMFSPEQFSVATSLSADLISGITDDMLKKINTQLNLAVLGEKTTFDAMKGIQDVLGIKNQKGIAYDAERIFRTEANRTFSLANRAQIEKLGSQYTGIKHGWIAADDERTRPAHWEAHERYNPDDGEPIPFDEPFILTRPTGGEDRLMYPGDPAGSPENTINCRCREIVIREEETSEI